MAEKQKGINYAIAEARQKIIDVINESALPPACMLLILGEITNAISMYVQQYAQQEKEEFEKENNDGDKND